MTDQEKTKEQLTTELAELRQRIALEAAQTERKRAEQAILNRRTWLPVAGMFVLLGFLVWLDEVLDLPRLLGAPHTPINWREAIIETVMIAGIGLLAVLRLIRDVTERKQAEKALRENEERFRQVAENAQEWIWEVDTHGLYTYASPVVEKILGYKPEELVGEEYFYNLFHAEDREELKKAAFEVFAQKQSFREFINRNVRKDGETVWLSTSGVPILDEKGNLLGYRGADADITEHQQAEERIEHLNLVLRAIRNVNQLITREKDRDRLLKGACDNLIETRGYHNAWIALFDETGGLVTTAEAGLGGDFLPLVGRLERGELTDCAQRALSQPGVVVTEDPLSTCAGCPLAVNCGGRGALTVRLEHEGKVYGLSSVSIPADFIAHKEEQALFEEVAGDIAFALHNIELEEKHKRAEQALRESEEKYRTIYDNAQVGLYRTMFSDGKVLIANKRMAELWGYESTEDCIAHCVASEHYADPGTREKLLDIMREHGKFTNFEARITKRDGTIIWLQYSGALFPEKGHFEGVATDITERKQAEEALKEYSERLEEIVEERTQELREAQEQLIRREKLVILGQLAGGVGHELRNPLGVISNAVYFLQMTLPETDETTREYLGIISSEVRGAEKIVSDLLDFSRTRLADREEIAVSDLVSQVLERRPPPEDVEVVTQIPADLPPVFVDPRQIGQVLGNLVTNAYQAMPDGGRLTIHVSEDEGIERRGDKGTRRQGDSLPVSPSPCLHVSMSDTGCGIPEENMKKIFEPLFTTKAKGIGLGLAVSKNLVEANGGSIEMESEMGKGSTFTVKLPSREKGAG